ncbi:hypothetical protein [Streptomyces sp. V3I7]|uniref:hypothetical protein n=1 Tax=Streptomyces sp. V3I7 TaxID=3042278 RepID=UPI00277D8398|nr:hypothetical protein [Streptomyces sp. V3I7]MDQ0991094.1 hypothetical protein [Streptomyces sp. V3I7]
MRLCTPLSLCLAAAAVLLPLPPAIAHAAASPACAGSDGRSFPLATRIHGGPDTYEAGGGYGTWYIDLANTGGGTCTDVHPVLVLVDDLRVLQASQPRLEFYDGARAYPVPFVATDEDELVGAFDGGLPGFTVGPGKTVTVKVRLAIAAGAVTDTVTANAAVVQRHGDDGDWIGQSDDYRFGITGGGAGAGVAATPTRPTSSSGPASPAVTPGPSASADPGGLSFADQLARTGLVIRLLALTSVVFLLTGTTAMLLARRRR